MLFIGKRPPLAKPLCLELDHLRFCSGFIMQPSALSYATCRKMLLTGVESGTLGQNREKYYFITSGSLGMVNNPATNTFFGAGV